MVNIKYVTNIVGIVCCLQQITACTSVSKPEKKESVPVEERSVTVEGKINVETAVEDVSPTLPATDPLPEAKKLEPIVETHTDANQLSGPAVVALLEDVKLYERTGKSDQAVATIERALRIEPKNPLLWQRLSFLRLRQGHWQQAISMAQKSNALAAGNKRMQITNWKIIAKACEINGNKTGLKQARQMIQSLSN